MYKIFCASQRKFLLLVSFVFILALGACNMVEYSPSQIYTSNSSTALNERNLKKLMETPGDDTVRFVLIGDTQREYDSTLDMVRAVNAIPGVDFLLLNGDISDFGLLMEMNRVSQLLSKLTMPYIAVIGNHDFAGNGVRVYKRMFGEMNFSFTYGGIRFICHNDNGREVNFDNNVPDLEWLSHQLRPADGVDAYIAVAHVPPFSSDFNEALRNDYIKLINSSPNTLAALYAHDHSFAVRYPNGQQIPYLTTNAMMNREFLLIEVTDGKLTYKNIQF